MRRTTLSSLAGLALVNLAACRGCDDAPAAPSVTADAAFAVTPRASTSAAPQAAPPAKSPSAAGNDALILPAQEGSTGCDLASFGATDRPAWDAFDARLRAAAKAGNAAAFADLIDYPLRVNRDGKVVTVATRAAFVKDATRIVTPAVMADVAAHPGVFCRADGMMYGNGSIWAQVHAAEPPSRPRDTFGIATVNVP